MKLLLITIHLIIVLFCSVLDAYTTENVHIVVIDGARYSETFGDSTHQFIPHIWNNLRHQGTIFTRYYNDSLTYTAAGHASIISGTWQTIPNDDSQRSTYPTLFEYYRKEKHSLQNDNFVILGKDKLHTLSYSSHPDYGADFGASSPLSSLPYNDTVTWNNFRSILTTYHPKLTITNLSETDFWGHYGDWNHYLQSISFADSIIDEMWQLIQSDSIYKNKTALIVTNDHGRHLEEWTSHGDGCDGCRHIMLLTIGPDFKADIIDTTRRSQIDIAPTVSELLNFSIPYCFGTSIVPITPPDRPIIAAPLQDTIKQQLHINALWHTVSRAQSYHVQLAQDSLFKNLILNDSSCKITTIVFDSLELASTYFWRVRAKNSAGYSGWSRTNSFTTISNELLKPDNLHPVHRSKIQSDTLNFSWNLLIKKADRYSIEIATDSLMTHPIFKDTSITQSGFTFKLPQINRSYWWHVKALHGTEWSQWSSINQFTTEYPIIIQSKGDFVLDLSSIYKSGKPLILKYNLPIASTVTIKVYSIDGTFVRTLLNDEQDAAFHYLTVSDLALSCGKYILTFNAGSYNKSVPFLIY